MAKTKRTEKQKIARNKAMRKWRRKHPEYHASAMQIYELKYPGRRAKMKTKSRLEHHLKHTYGLTLSEYDIMLKYQNNVCAICGGVDKSGRRLSIDHDHKTGQLRGLLCTACNTRLSVLENRPFKRKAIKYLKLYE